MFITYNGINLSLTNIDNVQRDTILSDDGTTVLYTEVTIQASAIYHLPVGGLPNLGGTSVAGNNLRNAPGLVNVEPNNPPQRNGILGQDPSRGGFTVPSPSAPINPFPGMPGGGGNILQPTLTTPTVTPPVTSGVSPNLPNYCGLPNPGPQGWRDPITTDRELELYLRVPRQKLLVWAFDANANPLIWIESPRAGMTSDAKTGPMVLGCHVRNGPNSSSFFVSLDIRTWLTPCEDGSDRPILSHRWLMVHNEDDNHFLTRTINGTVVFNPALLVANGMEADWFRKQFFHPIPLGFKRSIGPILLSEDGTTLKYQYSDTDQTIVFDPWNTDATQMEIIENINYNNPWRGIS